jgi:hypothetical protein
MFVSNSESILTSPYWMFFWKEKSKIINDKNWKKIFIKVYIHYLSDNPTTDLTPWVNEYREEIEKINNNYTLTIDNMLESFKN